MLIEHTTFFICMAVLQLLDVHSTTKAIKNKNGKEGNPFVAKLMQKFGISKAFLLIKIPLLSLLWFFPIPFVAQVILLVMYIAVVINNYKIASK